MSETDREDQIALWMNRIEHAPVSVPTYFSRHSVPFSMAQYYRYRQIFKEQGAHALCDGRADGNRRQVTAEAEGFLKGYIAAHPEADLAGLRKALREQFDVELTTSGMSRCLKRLGCAVGVRQREEKAEEYYTPCGGFELVVALACHLGLKRSPELTRVCSPKSGHGVCSPKSDQGAMPV